MRAPKLPSDAEDELTIIVDDAHKLGVFANAFRIVEEAGPDCFLDFMAYSAQEQRAEVVSRVRVRRAFLDSVRDLLGQFQTDLTEDPSCIVSNEALLN